MWTKLLILLGLYTHKGSITVKDAILITEAIPKKKWTTGTVNNGNGQYCFIGHLGRVKKIRAYSACGIMHQSPEIEEIDTKIAEFVKEKHKTIISHSYRINDDSSVNGYNENHPKDRMLHVLNDMKKAGIN